MLQKLEECWVKAYHSVEFQKLNWHPILREIINYDISKIATFTILETLNLEFWLILDLKIAQIY